MSPNGSPNDAPNAGPNDARSWQEVLAVLASPRLRAVYAEFVLHGPAAEERVRLTPAERRRLTGAGLLQPGDDGLSVNGRIFADLLSRQPRPAAAGPERFYATAPLRLLPRRAKDRHSLLEHIREKVLAAGESVSEPELNRRLLEFTADPAMLRRSLVDYGWVDRTPDGVSYRRAERPG